MSAFSGRRRRCCRSGRRRQKRSAIRYPGPADCRWETVAARAPFLSAGLRRGDRPAARLTDCFCLSTCPPARLAACPSSCLPAYLPDCFYLSTCPPARLAACPPSCLLVRLPTYPVPDCPPADCFCLSICGPVNLPTCPPVGMSTSLPACLPACQCVHPQMTF